MALAATKDSYPAPSRLPHVTSQMLTAGFWIARHPSVDTMVMSFEQINTFNAHIRDELKLTKDIFLLEEHFQTESLMDVLKNDLSNFTDKGYYNIAGIRNDSSLIDKAKVNMHLSGVVLGVAPKYGLVIHYADQRFLPTSEGLFEQKGDVDFDQIQNSALDIGTPVAAVHRSLDGKWYYVLSALSDGWVKAENIALGDMKQVQSFAQAKGFVVVTGPKVDIFLDPLMKTFVDFARMGVQFPLLEENDYQWVIQIPIKDKQGQLQLVKGYILKSQAHRGYLPYTARTIYHQAFTMLDKPYGWGDVNGWQDCSRFLQMVYATVGIELPRDTKNQAQVGQPLAVFDEKTANPEKLESLKNVLGASSVLAMKGHIVLYLGMADDIPFAVHATSGYYHTEGDIEVKYVINRVVVSDLSLGENSVKGSLIRRLLKIVGIQ